MREPVQFEFGKYSYIIHPNGDVYSTEHSVEFKDGHIQTYSKKKKSVFIQVLKNGVKGYPAVSLAYDKGKSKAVSLHRLLATYFIPNPDNLPQVNHKDGNKMNYSLDNLEWVSASQNVKHAYDNGLNYSTTNKQVYCEELDMIFNSTKAAADYINGNRRSISLTCTGKAKTYKKMHWKYI